MNCDFIHALAHKLFSTTMNSSIYRTRNLFLRCMAAIYVSAFSSFYLQIRGMPLRMMWNLVFKRFRVFRIIWAEWRSSISCSFKFPWQETFVWQILGESNIIASSSCFGADCVLLYGIVSSDWNHFIISRVNFKLCKVFC